MLHLDKQPSESAQLEGFIEKKQSLNKWAQKGLDLIKHELEL